MKNPSDDRVMGIPRDFATDIRSFVRSGLKLVPEDLWEFLGQFFSDYEGDVDADWGTHEEFGPFIISYNQFEPGWAKKKTTSLRALALQQQKKSIWVIPIDELIERNIEKYPELYDTPEEHGLSRIPTDTPRLFFLGSEKDLRVAVLETLPKLRTVAEITNS